MKPTDSPIWKTVIYSRDLLTSGFFWKFGNGCQISFWFNNRIEKTRLNCILNWSIDSILWPKPKLSDFITSEQKWNLDLLKIVLNNHPVIHRIVGVPILINEVEDSFCWGINSSSDFCMESTSWLAHGFHASEEMSWPYKWVWNIDMMLKIQIFLW